MTRWQLDPLYCFLKSFVAGLIDSLASVTEIVSLLTHKSSAVGGDGKRVGVGRDTMQASLSTSVSSPSASLAKARSMQRRQQEMSTQSREVSTKPRRELPSYVADADLQRSRILRRLKECWMLNGCIFLTSILVFEHLLVPVLEHFVHLLMASNVERREALWSMTKPILTAAFSALWVLPFFLLSKLVNALWFADLANSAFKVVAQTRPRSMRSLQTSIADFVCSLIVEAIFLVQASLLLYLPITLIGVSAYMLHLCLLNSLYCFEYQWFNQGLGLQHRLATIEKHWPYFLGFGLPLALACTWTESIVVSGCIFAMAFPLFILSANAAKVVPAHSVPNMPIFQPTISFSDFIFDHTFKHSQTSRH